jgi:hypothetical protein
MRTINFNFHFLSSQKQLKNNLALTEMANRLWAASAESQHLFGFHAEITKKQDMIAKCKGQPCQKPDVIIYKNTADFQLVTVSNSLIRQR